MAIRKREIVFRDRRIVFARDTESKQIGVRVYNNDVLKHQKILDGQRYDVSDILDFLASKLGGNLDNAEYYDIYSTYKKSVKGVQ